LSECAYEADKRKGCRTAQSHHPHLVHNLLLLGIASVSPGYWIVLLITMEAGPSPAATVGHAFRSLHKACLIETGRKRVFGPRLEWEIVP
jgi:hypothetical protein